MPTKTAAKKSTAAKKTASKPAETDEAKAERGAKKEAAEKAKAERAEARASKRAEELETGKKILKMRDDDEKSWATIAEETGLNQGKAMFLAMCAEVKPKDRLTADDDEALGALIVEARDGDPDNEVPGQSWGRLAARTGLGEGKVRSLYTESAGKEARGTRIGKGGRYPGDENPNPKDPSEKKVARSTKAKVDDLNPSKKVIADMDLDELKTRLTGKRITVRKDGKNVNITVKSVSKLKDGVMTYVDSKNGASRDVELSTITKASR